MWVIIAEPVARSWMSGHLELPRWLESQFGVLLVLALVLAVVALVTSFLKQVARLLLLQRAPSTGRDPMSFTRWLRPTLAWSRMPAGSSKRR